MGSPISNMSSDDLAAEETRDDGHHIGSAAVRAICGDVTDMTLWRWLGDAALEFPRPVVIRRRRYWKRAKVLRWWRARSSDEPQRAGSA